ncbi:MAG: pilus assembly PilX N-terminal domain-containing protein [Nitrospirae bacterium]|nr:pilus assembly PilX N-terminal domain-containing protein [Nitrospirota bacterium]
MIQEVPGGKFLVPGRNKKETLSPQPGTRNQEPGTLGSRGINLITTLFILIAISAIGLLLYRVTTTEQEASLRQLYSGEALYIAEAGVAWAVHNLESDCDWGQPGETPDCHEAAGSSLTAKPTLCQVQLPNGTAYISVTDTEFVDADGGDSESCTKRTIDSVGRRLGNSGRILAERRIRTTVD